MSKKVIDISAIASPEDCNGQPCKSCGEPIYGTGYRIVIATTTEKSQLPKFKETDPLFCLSCKNAMKW